MRLIDADEIRWADHYDSDGNLAKYKVAYSDEMPPTIDVVPVIRCQNCRHAIVSAQMEHDDGSTTDYYLCSLWHRPTEADGFCHRAEGRMDDD